jgi:hypothetical protein
MITRPAVLIGLVPFLLLAGCTAETSSAPEAPGTSTSALPGLAAPLPGSTPPGTRLRFGDKAVITVGRSDDPSRVGVIVTGVDPASEKDMASLRATYPEQVAARAYLIRVTLVNEDGKDDFGDYSGPLLNGDLDGRDAGNLKLLGANVVMPTCTDYSSPPAGWTARGARFETCRIIFADPVRVRLDIGPNADIYWE